MSFREPPQLAKARRLARQRTDVKAAIGNAITELAEQMKLAKSAASRKELALSILKGAPMYAKAVEQTRKSPRPISDGSALNGWPNLQAAHAARNARARPLDDDGTPTPPKGIHFDGQPSPPPPPEGADAPTHTEDQEVSPERSSDSPGTGE
jgi:hypothetical protein